MQLILLACVFLFIIYSSITGLLVYYFFKARDAWNIFMDGIYQDLIGLVSGCPKHNTIGLLIPGFIYSNSSKEKSYESCAICTKEEKIRQIDLYNVDLLSRIYKLLKTIDASIIEDKDISSRCNLVQSLLEYIIRNYKELHDGDYTLYERLKFAYEEKDKIHIKESPLTRGIETIPILEEYSSTLERLDAICQDINIEMTSETLMIAFYNDIRNFVKDSRKYLEKLNI
jgi:hypothetical protein